MHAASRQDDRRRVLHLPRDRPRSRFDRIEQRQVLRLRPAPVPPRVPARATTRVAANTGSRRSRSAGATPGSTQSVNSRYRGQRRIRVQLL